MSDAINLGLIYGSTREGRFCDTMAGWAASEINALGGFRLDLIDPVTLGLPARPQRKKDAAVLALARRISACDAFVVVVPEYNRGYPAALKQVLDSVYEPWRAKPVAFISYGGISGGLRAVEQLRLVFVELQAMTIRESVSFANAWDQFDAAGQLVDPAPARDALSRMLVQLKWWALVLREARRDTFGEEAA